MPSGPRRTNRERHKSSGLVSRYGDSAPMPIGTEHTKTWFTPAWVIRKIGDETYPVKVGLRSSERGMTANSLPLSLTSRASWCP